MLQQKPTFKEVTANFTWDIPEFFNIGFDICDKWANDEPDKIAIVDVNENGDSREFSFGELQNASNQLANALKFQGISGGRKDIGDRVAVLLPQCFETAVTHVAASKMGCVSLPLFTLFGEEALLHRLKDSGARAVITNKEGSTKLSAIRNQLPDLQLVLSIDGKDNNASCFHAACDAQSDKFNVAQTRADDPAILIYTSGTTGNPKGALHAHRVLLGHLPGVEISHNFLPRQGDRFWTPADWAWIGGLLDVMMPALHHGIPIVACRFTKFSAEAAFDLIKTHRIRNSFLPPTAIKIMKLLPDAQQYELSMRSVASGGETLGAELIAWGDTVFGTTINEFYGQTECNMVVSSCSALEASLPGSMGRAVPGHRVEIVDPATGVVQDDGVEGAIAVLSPDPVMFLGYWNNPEATRKKFIEGPDGKWLLTGDRASKDNEGRIHFLGRDDDVIGSAGYRIGPSEIEDCLIAHEAIRFAGVVGKPDKLRGSVVAAYVTLSDGFSPTDKLAEDIAEFVKSRLAAHEYPRVVRFIDDMPMTTTGKIIRGQLRQMALEEAEHEQATP